MDDVRLEIIMLGEGYNEGDKNCSHPYQVDLAIIDDPRFLLLSEGRGHTSFGGYFFLRDMLDDCWERHLKVCNCLFLIDLARIEQQQDNQFTAKDILEKFREFQTN